MDRQTVLEYAYALVQKYGQASGELACMFYEQIATAQNVTIPPAEMAALPEFGEVAKAINGAIKQTEKNAPGAVERLTKQVGADTMLQNAKRDGAYFAWITSGDTCAYCMMMSAIGWQRAGKKTLKGDHAEHIHAHCDCQYVVDFKGDLKVDGFDPENDQKKILKRVDPDGAKYGGDYKAFLKENAGKNVGKRHGLNALQRSIEKESVPQNDGKNKKFENVLKTWLEEATPNSHKVVELNEIEVNGIVYRVDGINVFQNNSKRELEVADIIESTFGGELSLVPEVKGKYKGIKTPDYIYRGGRWDLKELSNGTSKNLIRDIVHKKKGQSENFVFDISECKLSDDEIFRQAEGVFSNYNNMHAETVMIVKHDKVIKVYKRIKK